jgi:pullulanase
MTLVDKITASVKDAKPADIAQLSQLAASIALLSQGMPFIQAGQEFLRSKGGDTNSYKSSDLVNSLKWGTQSANAATVKYYKGLIACLLISNRGLFTKISLVPKEITFPLPSF